MPTYTGTLTGSGEFVGTGILSGVTEDVSQSDDVTAELVLNSNGTFTGTEDQVFTTTVTINFPGEPSSTTTSTYDTGAKPISGSVNTPYITTITENGNTITTTWIFSSDHSTINVTATDAYSSTGISGGYDLGGTLSAPPIIISSTSAQGINGESGTSNYVEFIITLSQAQTVPVTVHYATQDDTAQANVNYVPISGTLTLAAGKTTAVVDVHTIGTTDMVGNTDFDLVLSSPTNAELPGDVTSQPYTGTILDINTLGPTSIGGLDIQDSVNNFKTIGALGTGALVMIDNEGLGGTVTNTAVGVIEAIGSGADVQLLGATILGGVLKTSGTNAIIDAAAGTDDVISGAVNSAVIQVDDSAILEVQGVSLVNNNTIVLAGSGFATLQIDNNLNLTGGGKVLLSGDGGNGIVAQGTGVTLINVNNTIGGAGTIGQGDGFLTLKNSGTINANASSSLIIETGNTVINTGVLEGTSSGGLDIQDNVNNFKTIGAIGAGALVTIDNQGFGGTIINTAAGVIEALGSGADVQLSGATILGGVLKTSGTGAAIEALSGTDNVISGAAISGAVIVDDGATLTLSGVIANSGTLLANGDGSTLAIAGTVNGGVASIGNGVVDIQRASNESVLFQSAGTGGLQLDAPGAYSGKISGFGANTTQFIDFTDIGAGATFSYTPSASNPTSGGLLTVSSGGALVASIHLVGSYATSNFISGSDASGNFEITDPGVHGGGTEELGSRVQPPSSVDLPNIAFGAQTTLAYAENKTDTGGTLTATDGRHTATLALLGSYVAGSFTAAADGHGGTLVAESQQLGQQPLLTHPPHG